MKENDVLHVIQKAREKGAVLTVDRSDSLVQGRYEFVSRLSWERVPGSPLKGSNSITMKGDTLISSLENVVWSMADEFTKTINPVPIPMQAPPAPRKEDVEPF